MSYKVIRNAAGEAICFGPNTDQYQPGIPAGAALTIEASVPPKSIGDMEKEASTQAKATLANLRAETYPDVLAFLSTLAAAPQSIKDASTLAATEKSKVKP